MAFSVEGLTFGDFSSLSAEEYTELFGTGNKQLHNVYLELPWDEEENLQSVLRPLQEAERIAAAQRLQAQQQQQLAAKQQPPHQATQNPQYEARSQQQTYQHQQQQQQQQQQAPVETHNAHQHYTVEKQATEPMAEAAVTPHPTAATNCKTSIANAHQQQQQVIQSGPEYNQSRTVQAEMYMEKAEEGAGSSDGGNTDGDGKRRRNKKRRDPNYYKNFYENPTLYISGGGSTETAYYADNESSSGSSSNTSEAHGTATQEPMHETAVDMNKSASYNEDFARKAMQSNVDAQILVKQQPNVAPYVANPGAAAAQPPPDNRTSDPHSQGYVAPSTYTNMNVREGSDVVKHAVAVTMPGGHRQTMPHSALGSTPPPGIRHPAGAPPPGLPHPASPTAQVQKSQYPQQQAMPANITNVQDVSHGYRTTKSGEGQILPTAPSPRDIKPSPASAAVIPKNADNASGVATSKTVQNYAINTVQAANSNTLNASAAQPQPIATPAVQHVHKPVNQQHTNMPVSTASPVLSVPPVSAAAAAPVPSVSLSTDAHVASLSTPPGPSLGSSTPIASPASTAPIASPPAVTPSSRVATTTAATPQVPAAVEASPAPTSTASTVNAPAAAAAAKTAPSPTPAPAAPAPVKPTSWAGLFKAPGSSPAPTIITTSYNNRTLDDKARLGDEHQNNVKSSVSPDDDPRAKELADILSSIKLSYRVAFLRPRGLTNTGNWCYINSILQALVACPPLTNLVRALPYRPTKQQDREATSTPMLNALVHFFHMFQTVPLKIREKREIRPGPSFEPTMVYHMLSAVNISLSVKQGRQEDAEEFLSCLLNGLHEEVLAVMGSSEHKMSSAGVANGPKKAADGDVNNRHTEEGNHVDETHQKEEDQGDEDDWEKVGPKNKSSVTRGAHFTQTPLSKIFGGQMRSALHQQGSRESATLQPFFTLQLDIQDEKIWSVRDALDSLGSRESLQGFTCNKTKQEVEASRRITLEELPPILILHLKCFVYDKTGGCQKLIKKLDYNMDLEMGKDLLSPTLKTRASVVQRSYRLIAVVYHVGKEASGGHYITDVFHQGLNTWMRMDDSNVRFIKAHQVVKPQSSLTPYILFYRRNDCGGGNGGLSQQS